MAHRLRVEVEKHLKSVASTVRLSGRTAQLSVPTWLSAADRHLQMLLRRRERFHELYLGASLGAESYKAGDV